MREGSARMVIFPARLVALNLAVTEALGGRIRLLGTPSLASLVDDRAAPVALATVSEAAQALERGDALACFPELHPSFPQEYVDVGHGTDVQRYGLIEALLLLRYRPALHIAEFVSPRDLGRRRPRIHYRRIMVRETRAEAVQREIVLALSARWPESARVPILPAGKANTPVGRIAAVRAQLQLHASALRLAGALATGDLVKLEAASKRLRECEGMSARRAV